MPSNGSVKYYGWIMRSNQKWSKRNENMLGRFNAISGAISQIFDHSSILKPDVALLMELYEAEKSGQLLTASCMGLDAGIPTTTTIRCVRNLEGRGWIMRSGNKADRRIQYVRISPSVMSDIDSVLDGHALT